MNTQNGRVIEVQRTNTIVALDDGSIVYATVRGEFHESGEYPKVGDYVSVRLVEESEEDQAVIEEILPRSSVIERFDETTGQSQLLVANVDLIIIVMGLDGDFNLSRLERYVALAQQSNIPAVIVLNKLDLATNITEQLAAVERAVAGVPVYKSEASRGVGLEEVKAHLREGVTAVLLGSSGAGKSTITNWLLGTEQQATQDVREDDSRGRHTTTTRQLFRLPTGAFLIDTPGMRELALAQTPNTQEGINELIEELATKCQFRNCDHEKSAGCAVLAAIEAGELSERALRNYQKLKQEEAWQQERTGNKGRYAAQNKKRSAQAREAAKRKRLLG